MKRNMKKILALLLAVAMIATTVSVDGIRNLEEAQAATIGIQPDESFDKITFSDFGSLDATYADGANQEGRAKGRDTLDKTVIRGEVYVGSISNKLQFFLGNKDHAWGGLAVEILSATDMTVAWGNGYGLSSDIAGVDFVGEKFNLMMSLELVNNDNGGELNDLKVGVWFNGVLYNQEYFYFNNVGAQFGNYFLVWSHGQGDSITIDSAYEKLDESYERITFADFNIPDGTYADGANKEGTPNGRATLDKTVICGDVYVESLSNKLQFFLGNKEHAWGGLAVEILSATDMTVAWGNGYGLSSDIAGVDFVGEKFNLMMSLELVDHNDSDGTPDDLKLGMWFEGVLYNQEYFYFNDVKDNFGNYFLVWSHGSGDSITIDSVYEQPDESFDRITFGDFNIPDGTYADGANKDGTANGRATLDKTIICGDVYVESLSNKLQFFWGNKEHAWAGVAVEIISENEMRVGWSHTGVTNFLESDIADVKFVGEKFNLMMSAELVDHDDSDGTPDDLKVGVWFNGVLYNQEYFYFDNAKDNFGNYFLVWSHGSGDRITISSNQPDETFDKITYGHFEIADGTYPYNPGELAVQGKVSERTTLDKTVLYGDILVQGGDNNEIIWGGVGPWNGLRIKPSSDGTMEMKWMNSHDRIIGDVITLQSSTAGVDFHGQEYSLMMSAEVINNDKDVIADDLKLGLWFNGRLYNQEYFILEDVGTIFGNHLSAWCPSEGDSVTLGSEQPDETFDKITFAHFGILDGTYSYNGDLVVKGTAPGKTTLDKTVISGDIQIEGSDNTEIIWGGVDTGWNGLRMKPKSDGTMEVKWMNASDQVVGETYTLQSKIAGVDFLGEKYNLMMSAEQINGGNDVKIGIWFNGALYNQQYFVISNVGTIFGNYFSVWCASEGNKVTFGSEQALLEQPNKDFEWITYSLFGVDDGKYEYNNGNMSVDGTYRKANTLNKTVICGDVEFSGTSGFQYIIGGTDEQDVGIWKGISLNVDSADQMRIVWWHGENYIGVDTLSSTVAGVDFIGDSFNLMTSIEVTDADGDGTNDVKLGIWFDGMLYKQTYYVISGVGDYLGGRLGVYVPNQGDYVVLNSMEEYAKRPNSEFDKITFSDFGLATDVCESTVEASASKYADKKFDKVVFSGDLRLSDAGDHTITYGGTSGENGLKLSITSASDASLVWVNGQQQQTIGSFTATEAGLSSFIHQTFNLKISTELIDNNGDGNKNDIKVGIWFNDMLWENGEEEYTIISDSSDSLGNFINIKVATGTSVSIRNDAEYQANPYYYEEIAEYRSPNVAPETPEGYVFGGWYADAEYTEWLGTEIVSGDAWAKFVEEDVLTAKPQIKVTRDAEGNVIVPTDSTSLRFATTVDDLTYRRISFYLSKETAIDSDTYNEKEFNTATTDENGRMVYEKLYYIGQSKDTTTGTESYKPTIFSWQSDYFKTFTLTGIPASDYKLNIKVVPYWITMDGTEVRGKELITCVADYVPGTNKSEAVSVDFLGEYTMPITGYNGPNRATHATDTMLFPDTVTDEYFKMVADAGVNVIIGTNLDYAVDPDMVKDALALGEKYGIGIYVKDSSIYNMKTADAVRAQISNYSSYESFAGMFIVDEPGTDSFLKNTENGYAPDYTLLVGILEGLGITYYANMYPIVDVDKEWWENIFGSQGINDADKTAYKTYISQFNEALNTKMMSYDYYPFDEKRKNDNGEYDLSLYFWNMATVREQAQLLNKPFWAYVQAGSQWNDEQNYMTSTTPYYPSESQFNWNVNTSLAFGAQGIQYFPLVQVTYYAYGSDAAHWDFERNGLIGAWGNKTQWYDYAQDANAHIAAIDSVLMNSYSEQIIASGSAQSDTSGLTDVTTDASYGVLKTVSGDALVGYFDYCGKTALYVVNYQMFEAGKATTTQNVTLSFDSAHNITKIENAETTKTSANSLTLTMEPGEGILLVIE